MNIFLGILFMLGGGAMIYYSNRIRNWFGIWSFAEQYLGGTQQGYILIGFMSIVIGVLALFGVINLSQ